MEFVGFKETENMLESDVYTNNTNVIINNDGNSESSGSYGGYQGIINVADDFHRINNFSEGKIISKCNKGYNNKNFFPYKNENTKGPSIFDHYKNRSFYYSHDKYESNSLETAFSDFEKIKQPYQMNEENSKNLSEILRKKENIKKEGIYSYDANFIFAVTVFIIAGIIFAYILLINYYNFHLEKKERHMTKAENNYIVTFKKRNKINDTLFYTGVGFISISVFALSLLTVKFIAFSNSKKMEPNKK